MDECVYGTSGSGVFNLADVFELVIDGFNQGPLPDKDLGLAQFVVYTNEVISEIWRTNDAMSSLRSS